jgi:hypothetical protein
MARLLIQQLKNVYQDVQMAITLIIDRGCAWQTAAIYTLPIPKRILPLVLQLVLQDTLLILYFINVGLAAPQDIMPIRLTVHAYSIAHLDILLILIPSIV